MILHLSTFHLEGGAGVAATRLHRGLLRMGEDSRMLTNSVNKPEKGITALSDTKLKSGIAFTRFVSERLHFYPYEKNSSVRFAFSPASSGADISDHPLVIEADIIHLHWINFGFLSLDSLEKIFSLGKPVVWTLHDMWAFTGGCHYSRGCENFLTHCQYCPYLSKPEEYDISFRQFERKSALYKLTKMALVSPSNWLMNLTQKARLTQETESLSIPNCIDTKTFKIVNHAKARKTLNLPKDKILILFAGANTQDPRKGFDYFKEAMDITNRSAGNVEVLIFGKSGSNSFDSFPVPVHYLGKISETLQLVNVYNAADMIVVPSLEDNLPNTIMEAMACGTPAVGFATGGIPEMIDHQINGFVAQLKSAQSLADGMDWVIRNNQDSSISRKARQKVENTYSEKIVTQQYAKLYRSLLQKTEPA